MSILELSTGVAERGKSRRNRRIRQKIRSFERFPQISFEERLGCVHVL